MLFFVLLMTMLSFIVEATPRCTNGYDPPGMEQTIVCNSISLIVSLPILVPDSPVANNTLIAQEVAFTSTAEMLQADYTYNQMARTYLKLNKKIGIALQMMPEYSMAY